MTGSEQQSMSMAELFAGTGVAFDDAAVRNLRVVDITTNSGRGVAGGMFLACAGQSSHGLQYVADAVDAGVAIVAWEPDGSVSQPDLPPGIAGVAVPDLSERLGGLADRFFGCPSAKLAVTGVTGTNGKSTTAYIVAQALSALGQTSGYMGTLGFGIGQALEPSSLTTPGCVEVHRRLRKMADAGARHVVMEVSSHALDQQRVAGVRFETAALTNLSRDHLDYHGDMRSYAEAKARLFVGTGVRTAVVNVSDAFGRDLAERLGGQSNVVDLLSVALVATDSQPTGSARLIGQLQGARAHGIGVRFSGDFGEALLRSSLWGTFNAENLLVAAGILLAHGFELDRVVGALTECVAPPGRMELIRNGDSRPAVIVDFAHTPDALSKALQAVRDHTSGEVWCVFGCGGDRDHGKRGEMGAVATDLADHVILTDDNPRNEDPQSIVDDILAGASKQAEVIRDRGDAIRHAIRAAGANDAVLIAGKGHESAQLIRGESREFSDARAARDALGRVA
ncbi:MAG: UDP-N-acetylmuramoyl-L-alanyl-D-glutamate--2,6-diaminopimelate ligase [Gammaproteobacteria bacterium]